MIGRLHIRKTATALRSGLRFGGSGPGAPTHNLEMSSAERSKSAGLCRPRNGRSSQLCWSLPRQYLAPWFHVGWSPQDMNCRRTMAVSPYSTLNSSAACSMSIRPPMASLINVRQGSGRGIQISASLLSETRLRFCAFPVSEFGLCVCGVAQIASGRLSVRSLHGFFLELLPLATSAGITASAELPSFRMLTGITASAPVALDSVGLALRTNSRQSARKTHVEMPAGRRAPSWG